MSTISGDNTMILVLFIACVLSCIASIVLSIVFRQDLARVFGLSPRPQCDANKPCGTGQTCVSGNCVTATVHCSDVTLQATCTGTSGCTWDGVTQKCITTQAAVPVRCSDVTSATTCAGTVGCVWDVPTQKCIARPAAPAAPANPVIIIQQPATVPPAIALPYVRNGNMVRFRSTVNGWFLSGERGGDVGCGAPPLPQCHVAAVAPPTLTTDELNDWVIDTAQSGLIYPTMPSRLRHVVATRVFGASVYLSGCRGGIQVGTYTDNPSGSINWIIEPIDNPTNAASPPLIFGTNVRIKWVGTCPSANPAWVGNALRDNNYLVAGIASGRALLGPRDSPEAIWNIQQSANDPLGAVATQVGGCADGDCDAPFSHHHWKRVD